MLGLAFMAGGFYLAKDAQDSAGIVLSMFLYTVAFAMLNGLFVASRYRGFKCPRCGGIAENVENDGDEGTPILKLCKRCDTQWRIGTR